MGVGTQRLEPGPLDLQAQKLWILTNAAKPEMDVMAAEVTFSLCLSSTGCRVLTNPISVHRDKPISSLMCVALQCVVTERFGSPLTLNCDMRYTEL